MRTKSLPVDGTQEMMQDTQNPTPPHPTLPPPPKWTDCCALHVNEHTDEAAQYIFKATE